MSPTSSILNENNEHTLKMAKNTAVGEHFFK